VALREAFHGDLPLLWVDEVKMRQAVVNLIVNAIKFSPEGAEVVVLTDREPKYVRIEVSDRGPGIRPEDATHIFEMFGQSVDAGETEAGLGGLGIGLHLVKRISELHGGHTGVNSIPGEGSHFWIRLPLSLAEAAEPDPLAPIPADSESRAA
jgi:signal transduction histidine kinase